MAAPRAPCLGRDFVAHVTTCSSFATQDHDNAAFLESTSIAKQPHHGGLPDADERLVQGARLPIQYQNLGIGSSESAMNNRVS